MANSETSQDDEVLMIKGLPLSAPLSDFMEINEIPSSPEPFVQYPFYLKQPTEKMRSLFNKYKEIFTKRLGDSMVSLNQMGSGALPGMPGSPLIDFLMTLRTYPPTAEVMKTLKDLNLGLMFGDGRGTQGDQDTWMRSVDFPPEGDFEEFKVDGSFPPEGHLGRITVHIVHYSCPFVAAWLSYVEYLKSNEEAFSRYRDVKIEGAKVGGSGETTFSQYKKHKSLVIGELVVEALEWKKQNNLVFPEEEISGNMCSDG